ncbi:galactokinase [Clostridium sp. MSJ-11]|uniref:Galactokinase n=1 Tax=Clostridium mobile TaxID=2841512 RepID=A0ABS6EIF1_9CLOT|nr:galactokinase [Clostridium mobile]MBU5484790.1 galactokinase [Clostridium mobile]
MNLDYLKDGFIKLYGDGEIRIFHSPGRVNLIGEHIDYNGGYVFPCALDFGTYGLVRKRKDRKINLCSMNFPKRVQVDIDNIVYEAEDDWGNYIKGVIKIFGEEGYNVGGMDILISGNIPNGAGLSSSASVEVLAGVIIDELFNNGNIDKVELVKLCQRAENEFVGVNCGIMDQFAIGIGRKNKGILLDCYTLKYQYAYIELRDFTLVIMNTNKRRALSESKYNERRMECEEGLKIIKNIKNVENLCQLDIEDYNNFKDLFFNENVKKRVEHVIYENHRVKKAFELINEGKVEEFGELLIESHMSLKNLYEVTGKELDTIVDLALKCEGCIGARMTGAGFGGCAIAIVKQYRVAEFIEYVKEHYSKKIGCEPSFYLSGIGEGAKEC